MDEKIREIIKGWMNIKWNSPLSIKHIKVLLSDYDHRSFRHSSVETGFSWDVVATCTIRFLLAKDEIQENRIKELETKIKSLEGRVSINYRMLIEEKDGYGFLKNHVHDVPFRKFSEEFAGVLEGCEPFVSDDTTGKPIRR